MGCFEFNVHVVGSVCKLQVDLFYTCFRYKGVALTEHR